MQADYGTRAYVRLGIAGKAAIYREPLPEEMAQFQAMLEGRCSAISRKRSAPGPRRPQPPKRLMPISGRALLPDRQAAGRSGAGAMPGQQGRSERLGQDPELLPAARLPRGHRAGARPDVREFLDSNPGLQEFLDRPSVQEAFKAHRLDRRSRGACTARGGRARTCAWRASWRPESVASQPSVMAQAQNTIPAHHPGSGSLPRRADAERLPGVRKARFLQGTAHG